ASYETMGDRSSEEQAGSYSQPASHAEGWSRGKALPRPPRDHASNSGEIDPHHRSTDASFTIQATRSSKLCPAWAASSGTRDVDVMPGWVLISSSTISFSPRRVLL